MIRRRGTRRITMPGYKHPCRYCGQLVGADSNVCPFCGKNTPTGPLRCPQCRSPVEEGWKACSHCGAVLTHNDLNDKKGIKNK
jgi:predicted amidophosphoribosyltransferase